MAKEICISSTPHETRLAILEDDQLAEIYYERENEYTLAGSIYKGKVTRVLPGMQSAFVDVGLERDAFLYVTDFMEMEDPEDSDEVERAATQGTPVRQPALPQSAAQPVSEERAPRDGRRDGRDGRGRRNEPRPAAPIEGEVFLNRAAEGVEAVEPRSVVEAVESQDETDELGARRWRGRRRRRGGRRDEAGEPTEEGTSQAKPAVPPVAAPVVKPFTEASGQVVFFESEEPLDEEEFVAPTLDFEAAESTSEVEPEVVAAPMESYERPERSGRGDRGGRGGRGGRGDRVRRVERYDTDVEALPEAPPPAAGEAPFLLPGESLGRYGVSAKHEPIKLLIQEMPEEKVVEQPALKLAKPSTLVEVPLVWDGSGLLPGESIARRGTSPLPAPTRANLPEPDEEEESLEEFEELVPETNGSDNPASGTDDLDNVEAEGFEEDEEEDGEDDEEDDEDFEEEEESEFEEFEEEDGQAEKEHDASASHNVDPLPPSAFRLKDLFGGKKKEEPVEPAPAPKQVKSVSAYAPGSGHLEEEVIDEEEYDFHPMKAHHHDDHDLDDIEEETLQAQIRSGALGELLEEAQNDSRISIRPVGDEGATAQGGRERSGRDRERGRGRGRNDRGGSRGSSEGRSSEGRSSEGRTSEGRSSDGRSGEGRSGERSGERGGRGPSRRSAQTQDLPIISDLLKPGQEILVQIAKEPIAKKGARITSHIALPGRFLVFMPTVSHVGVSRKIGSDEERQRLKRILVSERGEATGGFIVRTAAEGATEEELRADLRFLINLWNEIRTRAESSKPPALIYHDLNLIERILRDQVSDNFSHIWVDSEADYERIVRFLNRFSPDLVRRVKLYTKEVPLFEHFGIQDEISKALRSKVWLKSGGSIVINQTEALVAIDINTGKYVGKTARLEDTILKTNLDAIPEIVRQIRLRDLGGIIVIDFIDMDERKNRTRVMAALEEALKQDRAPTKVLQFNDFGLVAITRKRVKQSLERTLSVPCPVCQATGMVKSPATVANEIWTEMRKMRKHFDQSEVLLRVHPETAKELKAHNARWLVDLEELAGRNVLIKNDATLHPEQFDIQG